jgi:hypothetical protein
MVGGTVGGGALFLSGSTMTGALARPQVPAACTPRVAAAAQRGPRAATLSPAFSPRAPAPARAVRFADVASPPPPPPPPRTPPPRTPRGARTPGGARLWTESFGCEAADGTFHTAVKPPAGRGGRAADTPPGTPRGARGATPGGGASPAPLSHALALSQPLYSRARALSTTLLSLARALALPLAFAFPLPSSRPCPSLSRSRRRARPSGATPRARAASFRRRRDALAHALVEELNGRSPAQPRGGPVEAPRRAR